MFDQRVAALLVVVSCLVSAQPVSPSLPSFLQGASKETIDEFNDLLASSGGKTDAQINADVEKWVAGQTEDIKVSYSYLKDGIFPVAKKKESHLPENI